MKIKDIVANSQYLTDETITDSVLVPMFNGAIAFINTEVKCELPFATTDNISTTDYTALTASWLLRLIEPYLCFAIFSNDTTLNDADYHYKRFLSSVFSFSKNGVEDLGEDYIGDSSRYADIDIVDRTVDGWF